VIVNGEVAHALRVVVGVARRSRYGRGNAVFFDFINVEATRLEAPAPGIGDDVDAGGGFQRVLHGGDAALIELCLGDDADGLRRFLRREGEAGGGAHRCGGVAARVFGAGVVAAAFDGNGL
jgi:hypothetical protein